MRFIATDKFGTAAERAADITNAGLKARPAEQVRADHAARIAARKVHNGPFARPADVSPQDAGPIPMVDPEPFVAFWLDLNEKNKAEGLPAAIYREARAAFDGGPTPEGALTFVDHGTNLRAVPAPSHCISRPSWHAEFRTVSRKGAKWNRVQNNSGNDICYTSAENALVQARTHADAASRLTRDLSS